MKRYQITMVEKLEYTRDLEIVVPMKYIYEGQGMQDLIDEAVSECEYASELIYALKRIDPRIQLIEQVDNDMDSPCSSDLEIIDHGIFRGENA